MKIADLLISVSEVTDIPLRLDNSVRIEMSIMQEENDRLDRLIGWVKSTYGIEISERVAKESPQEEADFWVVLNKVKAAHDREYRGISRDIKL